MLRNYFEDQPNIPVVCAGSLLDFDLEDHSFSMPVGRVEFLHLGLMTFFEFLENSSKSNILLQQLNDSYPQIKAHQFEQLLNKLKIYFYVGGMPEAIKVYFKTQSPKDVRDVHRSILQTYRNDFSKYGAKNQLPRIETLFDLIPNHIGKKIQYSQMSQEYDARKIKKVLHLLKLARLLHFCYHTQSSGIPLDSQKDLNIFKLYFLDIGLLHNLKGLHWSEVKNFADKNFLTKGVSAEQFVAQHVAHLQGPQEEPTLFYWLRDKEIGKAEVDFVMQIRNKIIPLEVKSGKNGTLKSLQQFVFEKKRRRGLPF
jgi:predicted AAA+ superfamily ATPase